VLGPEVEKRACQDAGRDDRIDSHRKQELQPLPQPARFGAHGVDLDQDRPGVRKPELTVEGQALQPAEQHSMGTRRSAAFGRRLSAHRAEPCKAFPNRDVLQAITRQNVTVARLSYS
jgi:hypothetical protein